MIAGVDEAGRGPLAGPVVASAVRLKTFRLTERIDDSKRLTRLMRERAYDEIYQKADVGVGVVDHDQIDALNILQATFLAMEKAVQALTDAPLFILIDGRDTVRLPIRQLAVCGGDRRCISIICASIIAKVTRDRIMVEYDKKYPRYGFAQHKGYGTKAHCDALWKYGPSPIHRRSFAPVRKAAARKTVYCYE